MAGNSLHFILRNFRIFTFSSYCISFQTGAIALAVVNFNIYIKKKTKMHFFVSRSESTKPVHRTYGKFQPTFFASKFVKWWPANFQFDDFEWFGCLPSTLRLEPARQVSRLSIFTVRKRKYCYIVSIFGKLWFHQTLWLLKH